MVNEFVYNAGYDNTIRLRLTNVETEEALDFTNVTRMVLILDDTTEVDSAVDAGAIDWSEGDGVVVLDLGDLEIPAGCYLPYLAAYDPDHSDGQVILSPKLAAASVRLEVVDVPNPA